MKVLYFTSTGNSLYAARQFTDEPMSIIALNRSGIYDIEDDEAIGIIVPDHVCDIPEPVRQYLKRAKLCAPYKFAIITYGSEYAAAPERLLELQNVDYLGTLLMVDNYFPVFNQGQQIRDVDSKRIPYHLNKIVSDIENRTRLLRLSEKSKKIECDQWRELYMPQVHELYKNFSVDHDKCIKCGICGKVCPMDNITYDPWPEIGSTCLVCGACRQNCPKNAIRFKGEKDEVQFRNEHVTVKDIINANNNPIQ